MKDREHIKRSVEALLFAADGPVSMNLLKALLGMEETEAVEEAISTLRREYEGRSFGLVQVAGGYQLYTRPEYGELVKELYKGRKLPKLSPQALETLAIIAYKQPITRIQIEQIRGTSGEGVVSTLLERGLIRRVGREKGVGRPILYGTTREFLRYFQLRDLSDLPEPENAKIAKAAEEIAKTAEENAKGAKEMAENAKAANENAKGAEETKEGEG